MDTPTKRGRFNTTIVVLAVTASLALILAGLALYARFQQSNQFRADQAHVWHAVICTIEAAVVKSHMPEAKTRESLRFYDHLLTQDVNAAPCGLTTSHHLSKGDRP